MTESAGTATDRPDPLTELDSVHLGAEQVERYLRRHGLRANKKLSQNHLVDGSVLDAIIEASGAGAERPVLEVGPGIGILTAALLRAGAQVTAVEVDPRLFRHLSERFADIDALRLVEGDILDTPMDGLVTEPWDLVANLPYHVTSPVLHQMLDDEPRPERFMLMVQREVAERIASPPGGLSYLSVFVQYHADVRIVCVVPPSAFEPAPSVDSAVLTGRTRPRRLPAGVRGRPLAAGPGRLPRATQDDPQRAGPAAADGRTGPDRGRPRDRRHRSRPATPDAVRGRVARDVGGARPHRHPHAMTRTMSVSEVAAPAKVNLALAVIGRWPNGYHELRSVFLRLDLADTVTIAGPPATPGSRDELVVLGDPDCPIDDNLVLVAIAGFRAACGTTVVPPLRGVLTKRIPMAAGLAGGSTDAASTLRLLAARHPGMLTSDELRALAARIGADVPFFLDGAGAALVGGFGEDVEPLPPPIEPVGVLLVRPAFGSATPLVFGVWDELDVEPASDRGTASHAVDALAHLLRSGATPGDLMAQAPMLRTANDLWRPAVTITPVLATLRETLEERLDRPVLMTGSGSTLFALYPDPGAAERAGEGLGREPSLQHARIIATRSTGPHQSPITSRRIHEQGPHRHVGRTQRRRTLQPGHRHR